ncbi:STAS domain-containing protein [Streptomyces sp. NPDC058655]|uniref:STAS domain-containing protein n=1 Tax=Streptomyces sp. NPDC058655 TaxID=3346577 RepID=UPI0036604BCB
MFHVEVHHCGPDACEVTVTGELDVATGPDLHDALARAITTSRNVTVDLSGMDFCDCTGLGVLLAAARLARARGTDLQLRSVPHTLARLLRLFPTSNALSVADGPGPSLRDV